MKGLTMKTIEERSKEIFPDAFDNDEIIPAREGFIVEQQRRGYRIGAAEQKKIDIDRAVKYIDENVGTMTAIALRKYMEEKNDLRRFQETQFCG